MGILADDVARVREVTDIVQLISTTVALRKAGRRWQGLCPFHTEKTPSFSVNAEEGLYYCFGCRASGDAITFVRQTEGLDFAASVEMLAARANITLRYDSKGEAAQSGRRKKLTDVVAAAVEWYHDRLLGAADAGAARRYLRSRGIDGDEVRAFKLGWAPDDWDTLSRALRKQAPAELLVDAGLAYRNKRGGLTDNFRGRVLFPVFDVRGDPVGFGGRILPDGDGPAGPKYKNTPESSLYAKSRLLYGLNWAKDAIVRASEAGEVIVCEGYTDVIGLHAANLPQAVATCGTALTEDHVKMLSRFTKRIVLAFDADAAGSAAAERIYNWESKYALDVHVADLPEGSDPDDLARSDPEDLRGRVEEAEQFLRYRLQRVLERANMATAQGRVRAADAALAVLDEHPSELVRDQFLMEVADRCELQPDHLRDTVRRFRAARLADRGRAAHPGGAEARGITATELADPSIGEQVLLLRVHAPRSVPDWVTPGLFDAEIHRRIFSALAGGASLQDLHDVAEGEAATIVARLAAWEPPGNAEAVIGRLVYDAAARRIQAMPRTFRTTGDADVGRRWVEAQLTRDELRAQDWSSPVAERLVLLLEDLAPAAEPSGELGRPEETAQLEGGAGPFDQAPAASEEDRFYEDLPSPEVEGEYAANLPGAGEIQR